MVGFWISLREGVEDDVRVCDPSTRQAGAAFHADVLVSRREETLSVESALNLSSRDPVRLPGGGVEWAGAGI